MSQPDGAGRRPRVVRSEPTLAPQRVGIWRRFSARLWLLSLSVGLAAGVVAGAAAFVDYARVQPLPQEWARVMSVHALPPPASHCGWFVGRGGGAVEIVFYVPDSPRDDLMPAFMYDTCEKRWRVGDVVPLVRSGPGTDDVRLGVKPTLWYVVQVAGGVGVGAGLVVYVSGRLRPVLKPRWARWAARRRAAAEG